MLMQSHRHARLRRINSYLMLLAVVAFVLQGVSSVVARAAASAGVMPQPAEVMNGLVHFHGLLGHGLHTDGDNGAGHVHFPSGPHHDDPDDDTQIWSLSCTSAIVPMPAPHPVASEDIGAVEQPPHEHLAGVEPDGQDRPPSTPSIA